MSATYQITGTILARWKHTTKRGNKGYILQIEELAPEMPALPREPGEQQVTRLEIWTTQTPAPEIGDVIIASGRITQWINQGG